MERTRGWGKWLNRATRRCSQLCWNYDMNINNNGGEGGAKTNKWKKQNQEKKEDLLSSSLTCLQSFSPFRRDAPCQNRPKINKQIRKFTIQNSSLTDGAFASSLPVAGQAVRSDVPPCWCQHVAPTTSPTPPSSHPRPPLGTTSHVCQRCLWAI